MLRCENCGQKVQGSDDRCWHCGAALPGKESGLPKDKSEERMSVDAASKREEDVSLTAVAIYGILTLLFLLAIILLSRFLASRPVLLPNSAANQLPNTTIPFIGLSPAAQQLSLKETAVLLPHYPPANSFFGSTKTDKETPFLSLTAGHLRTDDEICHLFNCLPATIS